MFSRIFGRDTWVFLTGYFFGIFVLAATLFPFLTAVLLLLWVMAFMALYAGLIYGFCKLYEWLTRNKPINTNACVLQNQTTVNSNANCDNEYVA